MSGTWDETWSVGVPELDADHRRICVVLDTLSAKYLANADDISIVDTLAELTEVIGEHFSHEEQVMYRMGFSDADQHFKNHFEALRVLSLMLFNYEKNNHAITKDALELMGIWMQEHINYFDAHLARAMTSSFHGHRHIPFEEFRASNGDQFRALA